MVGGGRSSREIVLNLLFIGGIMVLEVRTMTEKEKRGEERFVAGGEEERGQWVARRGSRSETTQERAICEGRRNEEKVRMLEKLW